MSKVTYNRGERQKPTTPAYRDNYDQIDLSKKPDPTDETKPTEFIVEGEGSVYFDNPDIYKAVVAGDAVLQEYLMDLSQELTVDVLADFKEMRAKLDPENYGDKS